MIWARRQGWEDKQIRALRMELRSCRLNGSGMNKIARTTPGTLFSINRSVHVQSYNRCGSLAVMPAEIVFDATEAELGRRGVEPYKGAYLGPFVV
jgi:hypothetical protein